MTELIVHSSEILNKHTLTPDSFDYELIRPFVVRVEKDLIKKISNKEWKFLKDYTESDSLVLDVKSYLECYISHMASLTAMPFIQNRLRNNGIDDNNDTRDWWKNRDLLRSYRDVASTSLNNAIILMNESLYLFEDYRENGFYIKSKEILYSGPEEFSEYINIQNSWITYTALIPIIKHLQFSEFTILDKEIFTNPSSNIQRKAQGLLKAIIAYRVKATILNSNQFTFDSLGFSFKIEILPWEKQIQIKEPDKLIAQAIAESNVYRKSLDDLMDKNKSEFGLKEPKPIEFLTKRNSGLGLS